jgi:ribosome biogenesis GTPase A
MASFYLSELHNRTERVMNIQWYPGHMAKSKRLLADKLKLISVAVIVVDARAPKSTFNPELDELLSGKECILVLNKCDLADEAVTEKWVAYYKSKYKNALAFSATQHKKGALMSAINRAAFPIVERYAAKGMKKTIRVLVAGIPNVGKSAIINRLASRKGAKEGNKPGITRGLQWVRLSNTLELMDSPGLLWPKIESEDAAVKIALSGCIKEEIMDLTELAVKLIDILKITAPAAISERYGFEPDGTALSVLENICIKRGFLLKQGEYDFERGAKTLIDEFKGGRLGRITLESPDDID